MSEKALELVRQLKHLPGKHPQKSHAGGRGGGSSKSSKFDPNSAGAQLMRSSTAKYEAAVAAISTTAQNYGDSNQIPKNEIHSFSQRSDGSASFIANITTATSTNTLLKKIGMNAEGKIVRPPKYETNIRMKHNGMFRVTLPANDEDRKLLGNK